MEAIRNKVIAGSVNKILLAGLRKELDHSPSLVSAIKTSALANECLQGLEYSKHSLAITFILKAKISLADSQHDLSKTFDQIQQLFCTGDWSLVDEIPTEFVFLAEKFAEIAVQKHWCMKAVFPLQCAVDTFVKCPNEFTLLHVYFIQVCLTAKHYKRAKVLLENPIFSFSNTHSKPGKKKRRLAHELMRYFYYGARVYAGLKEYRKALHFCKLSMTVPATALNAVAVEAYKLFVIISLAEHGEVPKLPKYTPNVVQRYSQEQTYEGLVKAYKEKDIEEIKNYVSEHESEFAQDGTLGLVKQGIHAFVLRRIHRLTHTYLTFSLEDISKDSELVDTQEAEQLVLEMIEKDEIQASVNQLDGMVKFEESIEQNNNNSTLARLDCEIQHIDKLVHQLCIIDDSVAVSKEYVKKLTQRIGTVVHPGNAMSLDIMDTSF
mmetsp:Transcript_32092/g.39508  ORF Transcript_32092/g.39508 Transcript_32092/m.39508 type:complete len:435 (+) Transcript_32092:208-1512(+)|eukprot:CAMPEP_0204834266 /NCGR_PEP_ID=MMETSP1346-20131115/19356_1 /ASSEMBLY_ACC=CAM_ASM_000771 /TAXON_ID=215587 /ORGANISM="Aplanochytrium stocchinoi, Strain GSBS06" /LENGTH=434 /DNA_ID=CAMNT_0051967479 /DNA_START=208 /DNA_END=1512 /DNA_ORIENTATION=+